MSKLAKEAVSKAAARKGLWVRVPPAASNHIIRLPRRMGIHHLNHDSHELRLTPVANIAPASA